MRNWVPFSILDSDQQRCGLQYYLSVLCKHAYHQLLLTSSHCSVYTVVQSSIIHTIILYTYTFSRLFLECADDHLHKPERQSTCMVNELKCISLHCTNNYKRTYISSTAIAVLCRHARRCKEHLA